MRLLAVIAAVSLTITAPALATDSSVAAPTDAFLAAFNKGDMPAALATFATGDITIVDEFAPFYWVGPHAPSLWAADFGKFAASKGQSGGQVTLGAPTRTEVATGTAYIIRPAHYTFTEHGVAMVEDGQITFALRSEAGAWKITAWAWNGPVSKPVR